MKVSAEVITPDLMGRGFLKSRERKQRLNEWDLIEQNIAKINLLEDEYRELTDDQLLAKTIEFRSRIAKATENVSDSQQKTAIENKTLDELLPEAFAAVREASVRSISMRHFDVQLAGGIVLHHGRIAEMKTGEGKTLVATLAAYLNTLTGKGVHIVTVNDYLARRDARWMGPVFRKLGLSVGVLQAASRTENGRKAFLYAPEDSNPIEELDKLRYVEKREAYRADITYGTNSEFGFDYLRDNIKQKLEDRVQRGSHFAIVDEVDNILIDEARTPLIISGLAQEDTKAYQQFAILAKILIPSDYEVNEKDQTVNLTETGRRHVEAFLGKKLVNGDEPESTTPELEFTLGHIEQALKARLLYLKDKHYIVHGDKVVIVDEFTGRMMPGRRWSDGLHQAIEAKEGVAIQNKTITYATITLQNFFRLYKKLSGMSGTAKTDSEEFDRVYHLGVTKIPTNVEYQVYRPDSGFTPVQYTVEDRSYTYFANTGDPNKTPVFWQRKDLPDLIYQTYESKLRAIVKDIIRRHISGQPILVGTTSVENSTTLSNRLTAQALKKLAAVLLIKNKWFEFHGKEDEGLVVEELLPLNSDLGRLDNIFLAEKMQNLGLPRDLFHQSNLKRLGEILSIEENKQGQLESILGKGIKHFVLNAKNHAIEAGIIARAGELGAVTVATNMAGRGVDIKLGGDLAEELIASVNRVLYQLGIQIGIQSDPYKLTNDQRLELIRQIPIEKRGIYEAECELFIQMMEEAKKVRELGGLHVIGAERYEARRIDNQLRGRAARQGDPGSSQFFLSFQDELMSRFGSQSALALMQRLRLDPSLPLSSHFAETIVEESQNRVEGANFDVRKHLLEYDDVLAGQRQIVYEQREKILAKPDLTDDVMLLVGDEIRLRISKTKPKERTEKLIGFINGIMSTVKFPDGKVIPNFTTWLSGLYNKQDIKAISQMKAKELLGLINTYFLESIEAIKKYNPNINEFWRQMLFQSLDFEWIEHLSKMEGLRTCIGLEAYGGRDPLAAYKIKASDIFHLMMESIRTNFVLNFIRRPSNLPTNLVINRSS